MLCAATVQSTAWVWAPIRGWMASERESDAQRVHKALKRIAKARARFINDCTGTQLGGLITLKPLAQAYQSIPSVSLWGPDDGNNNATTSPVPVSFTMPAGLTGC